MIDKLWSRPFLAIFDQGLFSFANFFVAILFARANSIQMFGFYSILMTIVVGLILIQYSLITQPHNILAGKVKNKKGRYFRYYTRILWNYQVVYFLLLFVAFLGSIFVVVNSDFTVKSLILFFGFIVFRLIMEFMRRVYYSGSDLNHVVVVSLSFNLLILVASFLCFKFDVLGIDNILLIYLASAILSSYIGFKISEGYDLFSIEYKYIIRGVNKTWSIGRWILASNIVFFLSNRAYIFIISVLATNKVVGVYAAFLNIVNVFNPLMLTLSNYFLPVAVRKAGESDEKFDQLIRKIHLYAIPVLLLVIIVIAVFSYEILYFLYGEKYSGFYIYLRYFSFILFFIYLSNIYQLCFKAFSNIKPIFISSLTSLVFMVVFGIYLIKAYMFYGVIFVQLSMWAISVVTLGVLWVRSK